MKPEDLTKRELAGLVRRLVGVVWPGGDPDAVWDPDTIAFVATALATAGLKPEAKVTYTFEDAAGRTIRESEGDREPLESGSFEAARALAMAHGYAVFAWEGRLGFDAPVCDYRGA